MGDNLFAELSAQEIDSVSGGNPVLVVIAAAALGFQVGKSIAEKRAAEMDLQREKMIKSSDIISCGSNI